MIRVRKHVETLRRFGLHTLFRYYISRFLGRGYIDGSTYDMSRPYDRHAFLMHSLLRGIFNIVRLGEFWILQHKKCNFIMVTPIDYIPLWEIYIADIYGVKNTDFWGTLVDIGAGVGEFTLYAWCRGSDYFILVEPSPIAGLLHYNMTVNMLSYRFYNCPIGGIIYHHAEPHRVVGYSLPCRIWDIRGDILKIDCEGCEWSIPEEWYRIFSWGIVEVHGDVRKFIREKMRKCRILRIVKLTGKNVYVITYTTRT